MVGRPTSCGRSGSKRGSWDAPTAPPTWNGAGTKSSQRSTGRARRTRGTFRIPRRRAGLSAASVALADAGVPMRDLVASCASGKIEGVVCLDLNKDEDNFGDADCPMAIVPRTGEIVLLQMDGHLTYDEFQKAMDLSIGATHRIYELQRDALRRRYSVTLEDILKESPPLPPPPPSEEPLPPLPPEDDFGPEGI